MGAEDVALEARHPHQREAGERLGAPIGTDGVYDVVVEAAGTTESLARAIELVAPGGTVVVLGVHLGTVELNWMPLFHREARIIPSLGYCRHDGGREMEDAAKMLADDPEIAAHAHHPPLPHRGRRRGVPRRRRQGLGRHPGRHRAMSTPGRSAGGAAGDDYLGGNS